MEDTEKNTKTFELQKAPVWNTELFAYSVNFDFNFTSSLNKVLYTHHFDQ
jgi:hypothetical protein